MNVHWNVPYSIGSNSIFNNNEIKFDIKPQPSFNKSFELLIDNLNNYEKLGYKNYLCCANEQQKNRFSDIFDNLDLDRNTFNFWGIYV